MAKNDQKNSSAKAKEENKIVVKKIGDSKPEAQEDSNLESSKKESDYSSHPKFDKFSKKGAK